MSHPLCRKAWVVAFWLTAEHVCAQTVPPQQPPAAGVEGTGGPVEAASEPSEREDEAPPSPEQECIHAHEQAQVLRLDGNLRQSRTMLQACSLEVCPAVVQRDCVRWLDEVSTQIPTVVFEAITESGAAQKVTVKQGSAIVTRELDGRPIEMNPGYYEFSFEISGRAPKFVSILLKQGEKNRLVSVDFREQPPTTVAPNVPEAPPTPPPAVTIRTRPVPTTVYALGGIAIVGAAAATVLGINTRAKEDLAYEECAPRCSQDRIDNIKRWALATDAALGVAVISTVAAAVLYVRRPVVEERVEPTESAHWVPTFLVTHQTAWAGVEGSF